MKEGLPSSGESAENAEFERLVQERIQELKNETREAAEKGWAINMPSTEEGWRRRAERGVRQSLAEKKAAAEKQEAVEKERRYIAAEGLTEEEEETIARMRAERKLKK